MIPNQPRTPDQQKDAERLDRYIVREGLSSVMNDTKWRETRAIIKSVFGSRVWFRTKDVRGEEPLASGWWETDFTHHMPCSSKWVEWLEIDPVVSWHRGEVGPDHTGALVAALRAKNIPFYMVGTVVRIQGYTRAGRPTA